MRFGLSGDSRTATPASASVVVTVSSVSSLHLGIGTLSPHPIAPSLSVILTRTAGRPVGDPSGPSKNLKRPRIG